MGLQKIVTSSMSNYKRILIDSRNRTLPTDTSSNFKVKLDTPLTIKRVALSKCMIPNTIYNINSGNNIIGFNDGSNKTATITPGMYTTSSIKGAIESALNTASGTLTFTYTYNNVTGMVTLSATGSFALRFGSVSANSAASWLGFGPVDTVSAASHTGDNISDMGYSTPYILVNVFNTASVIGSAGSKATWVVPINAASDQYISYEATSPEGDQPICMNPLQPTTIISVSLTDAAGNFIDLNGGEWWMLVEVD